MSIITPPQTISEEIRYTTYIYENIFSNNPTSFNDRPLWGLIVTNVKINNKSNILYIPRGTQNVNVNLSFNYYSYIKWLHPELLPVVAGNPPLYLNISWYIGPVTGQAVTPILSRAMNTLYDSAPNYWMRDLIYGPSTQDNSFSGTINIPSTVPGDVYYITHTYDFNSAPSGTKQFSTNSQPIAAIILMDPIFDTLPTRTIYDDTEAGTIVYKININDSFHQNYTNFKIEYSLIEIEDYLSFIIDLATGDVLLLKPQLSRVKSSYTFSINANIIGTYKGAFINYDEILQSIVINNISRQSSGDGTTIVDPIFLAPPPVSISIYDDILPGTLVYGANVYNQEGNPLLFSFTNLSPNVGTDFSNFIINPVSGDVSIITPKSKSDKPSYSFVIKVIDTITKKSALESITITNNERLGPKFYSPTIQLNTYEDAPDFTLVYGARVKTQKGSSLQFSFDISGNTATRNININDSSNFIIDSTTGEVRIIKSQSVTSTTAYNFKISVKDTITNLSDTQSLTITNNYGTPYFLDGSSISITVYDDHDLTEKIYTPKLNYTSDLGYTLVSGLFDNDFFTFNNDISGNVFLTKQPYAEGINEYTFQIKATNSINNKYATQQVLVNIKKRPLPPYFTDISYNIQLDDTIQAGKLIYNFIAVSAYENKIKYYIIDDGIAVNGDDTQFFNMDINNGSLTFTDLPDKLDYKIKIKVVDIINLESLTSSTIEIHLNNIVYFQEGDNKIIVITEKKLENSIIYTPVIKYNSKFINNSNINLNINGEDKDKFTINANGTIHADNVYFSINNSPKTSPYNFELVASIPVINLTLKQSVRVIVNFTSCTQTPPNPPNLWSRATLSCVDYDQDQLAMRRKAEVLKYKGNQNPLTKNQKWSRIVNGNGPLGKKVWATQNDLGSNPNVFNLEQVGNTLILCPNTNDNNNYTLSSTLLGTIFSFGETVSISGDGNTLAITSFEEKKIYIYTKNINNSWSVAATLSQPTITSFGSSMQLSYDGNTLITGAYLYPLPSENGIIYIYENIASVWTQTFNYTGTNTLQRFGKGVSISNDGSVIAVGSEFDNNTTYNGKIEVFERIGPHWNSAVPIGPIFIANGFNFEELSNSGLFLSGNGNFIASTTIANKIYVYKKSGLSWNSGNTSQTLTISSEYNVYFDTNANYLCVGTLTGNIAYVYTYNTTTSLFELQQSFNNLDGTSKTIIIISPDGKYIAIGMPDVNSNTGVVYIYKIINNTWNLIEKIYGDGINDIFGASLSFNNDGSTLVIGSPFFGSSPGKAYIYFRNGTINKNTVICEPSSSSDVPGNSILCYDPAVPLVNYLPPPRTYLAGGTKWPQSTWKPGDNGFPRGKKGSMNMLFQ
jgi:hypothetical protein